jgi:hypothetical protein
MQSIGTLHGIFGIAIALLTNIQTITFPQIVRMDLVILSPPKS